MQEQMKDREKQWRKEKRLAVKTLRRRDKLDPRLEPELKKEKKREIIEIEIN